MAKRHIVISYVCEKHKIIYDKYCPKCELENKIKIEIDRVDKYDPTIRPVQTKPIDY